MAGSTTLSIFVGACLMVALLAGGVLLTPALQVAEIRVSGATEELRAEAETVAREHVQRHARFADVPRIFLIRTPDLAAELRNRLPALASVRVLRRLPGTLDIHIQERVEVAFLDVNGNLFSLDDAGRAIAAVTVDDARRSGLPVIRDVKAAAPVRAGDHILSSTVMNLLRDVVIRLPERLAVSVEELSIPAIGTQEVRVRTNRGWVVILDGTQPLSDQLDALDKVLTEELTPEELERLEYVDLRAAGKVFLRVRPGRPQKQQP